MNHKARDREKRENIALERIIRLMEFADKEARGGNLEQAGRLVELARKINTKTKTRIPKELKNRYCKHCYCYLMPGKTSKTRINSRQKRVEVTCLKCSRQMYYSTKKRGC
ncbi:MAG: ribonuclease P [Candidatus Altiarchaeales archaeon]|nr:ribonuclease P [Candidatus Altiarchaeales archaeon]